jgi:hypothetical protein
MLALNNEKEKKKNRTKGGNAKREYASVIGCEQHFISEKNAYMLINIILTRCLRTLFH